MTSVNGHQPLRLYAASLLTWMLAGVANADGLMMGNPPTLLGVITTLVAVCTWLVTAWFAGSRSTPGFLRVAVVFWAAVVVGTLLAAAALDASRGGIAPPVLLLALAAPMYGLTSLLSSWLPVAWGPLAWHAMVGIAALAMTVLVFFFGHRLCGPTGEEILDSQVPQ